MRTVEERFWAKVSPEPNSGCWLWVACVDWDGYGQFHAAKQTTAHRFSYEMHKGPIPDGLQIDHLCRVTCCVNPDHLEAVTAGENARRSMSFAGRNARKTHCWRGHPLSGENLYIAPSGYRNCKECRGLASKRHRKRGKARADDNKAHLEAYDKKFHAMHDALKAQFSVRKGML